MNPTGKGGFREHTENINRKGTKKNKTFDDLRATAVAMANETAVGKDGKAIIYNGQTLTNAQVILRQWMQSKDAKLQMAFIQYAFGKVPDDVNLQANVKEKQVLTIKGVDYRAVAAALAPGSIPDIEPFGQSENFGDGKTMG